MASAKEQAVKLSQDMREAVRAARAAGARARALGDDFRKLLIQVEVEAEAARNVVEYPPGRYECKACQQPMIFAETLREFPPCDSCGRSKGYSGPPPKVLEVVPEVPRKFPAGLYECAKCRAPMALVEGCDAHSPCEFCGTTEFRAL